MNEVIQQAIKQFFSNRTHITCGEMNDLLLEIIGISTRNYCACRLGEGATREEINLELTSCLQHWSEWQRETLARFKVFVEEMNDDTPTIH